MSEVSKIVHATHFIVELGVDNQMEIVINLLDLCEILVLHSTASLALGAVLARVWEQDLVNNNVVNVNFLLGELNSQSLSLVHTEELRDADSHEGGLSGILELLVNFLNLSLHSVDTIKEALLDILGVTTVLAHHSLHLVEHTSKLVFQFDKLNETLLKNVREVKQAQRVTSGCSIENDQRKVVLIERLDDFTEGSGFINTWDGSHKVLHETHGIISGFLVLALSDTSLSHETLQEVSIATALVGGRIDLHGEQVFEALDGRGLARELLIEGIGQVMSGISGNDQHL